MSAFSNDPSRDDALPGAVAEPARFLGDIHRLRGVAILLIVATHCVYFFHWSAHPQLQDALADLLDNSTVLFVFISGYLFMHGSGRFSYPRYLLGKLRHVILPFLLASIPAIALELRHDSLVFAAPGLHELSVPAKILYLLLYPGAHINYALWFIPVVTVYYLVSPLMLWVARRPLRYALLCLLVPVSILMHRPSYAHDHDLALALYFLSAYLLGMWCRQYRHATLAVIERHFIWFAAAFGAVFVGHLMLSGHHGKYTFTQPFEFHGQGAIDWSFVQKLLLLPLLCGLAWRWRHLRLTVLDYLADVSFTVFFLHLYVIFFASWLLHWRTLEVSATGLAALFAAAVLLPCAVATSSRRLVPQWSRSLVGS